MPLPVVDDLHSKRENTLSCRADSEATRSPGSCGTCEVCASSVYVLVGLKSFSFSIIVETAPHIAQASLELLISLFSTF